MIYLPVRLVDKVIDKFTIINFKNSINHHKKIGVYYVYKEGDCLCVSLI